MNSPPDSPVLAKRPSVKARRPQDSADGDPEELKPPASTPVKTGYVGEPQKLLGNSRESS